MPPRKIIIGTSIFSLFATERPYVSLSQRLKEVTERVDEIVAHSQAKHDRGPDIICFPENTLNSRKGSLMERSLPLSEEVKTVIGGKAKEHHTYIVVSFNMQEDVSHEIVYNVAVLFDRTGEVAGIYRKVFSPCPEGNSLPCEGGKTPGTAFPVFKTDFGRVGMLICYDMGFDDGFEAYAKQGVDLIVWPSMSPQTLYPRLYARRFGYHIVSATPRDNVSVFSPLGEIVEQATEPEGILTCEIDLEYRILHWTARLKEGKALNQAYGDRIGYRYDPREDYGIFWSNDPTTSIDEMLSTTGFETDQTLRQQSRLLREKLLRERKRI